MKKPIAPVPNWILCRKELTPGAKLHYGRLKQHQEEKANSPKLETLAIEEGCSARQIQNYNTELIKHGLIKITRRGLTKSNLYAVLDHLQWISEYEENED